MKRKRKYKKRTTSDITQTELDWIKTQNSMKLDEITSDVNYQERLGKKYYGERWHTILEKNHPRHKEYKKKCLSGEIKYIPYQSRPLLEYDLEGNFIREWESAKVWATETGNSLSASTHVAKQAQGRVMSQKDSAYGSVWKFKEDE
tara:strand:- start:394 stop:831 length:438 start_codon:yes stop_codon:yes gene_type:complete